MFEAHRPPGKLKNMQDFRYIFKHFFRDGYRHIFVIDFGSILTQLWDVFLCSSRKNGYKKTQQKHTCEKVMRQETGSCGTPPCPPSKQTIPGSQDWEPGQGIRDTPLVPGGTVADLKLKNAY